MITTVQQSAVDSLSLLGPILPMMPTTAINELATQLKTILDQQAQDIASNDTEIATLQQQVAELPNLQEAERQEVLNLINQELQNLNVNTGFTIAYRGETVEAQTFLQMLADQQAKKVVEVTEVTKTDGRVTSAKLVFDDASEQTVTFTRTEANGVATYLGKIPDGSGSVVDGYEFRLGIQQFQVAGLTLDAKWDGDLLSQKMFVTGLSIQFDAVQQGQEDGPDTL